MLTKRSPRLAVTSDCFAIRSFMSPCASRIYGTVIRGTAVDGRERPIAEVYRRIGGTEHEAIANAASACSGAKEAKEAIDAMGRFHIEEIVQSAIRTCHSSIILDRDAIQEEVPK